MQTKESLEIVKAYRSIFKSEKGRAVLLDMAKNASVFSMSSDLTPTSMAFKEGQRQMIFNIFNTLEMEYEEIIKLFNNEEGENDYEY